MNETAAATLPPSVSNELALRQLQHVGAAYLFIFVLVFAFAWRVSSATKRLSQRVDELERSRPH